MTDEEYRHTPADVADLQERLGIYEALAAAQDRWPDVSKLVYQAETRLHLVELIAALLGVSKEGATAVSEMQVQRLSKAERAKVWEPAQRAEGRTV